jgi:transposase
MFVKTTKSKNYEYINLVESYKENGKTKHKVLYNFGRSDLIKNDKMFINMVKKLCEIAEIGVVQSKANTIDCSEAELLNYGYLAYAKLWEQLGIGNCINSIQNKSKTEFSLNNTAFLMAMQHLLLPKSKLATYENQERYYGLEQVDLQHLYRCLDKIGEAKEEIENELFFENYTKTGQSIDVVFYDVTTFAFESVIVDELRNFGFSKACKFNEVQVVMGLLIDSNGLPIGYELFSGNTFDGKTMVKALDNIKKRFGINRVVIVADRGLNSKGNLNLIKDAGYGYIVASKIKSMNTEIKEKIFDEQGYITVSDAFKYKTIEYINTFVDDEKIQHSLQENLIVSYSEKRANKDRSDRTRLIEKAKKLLAKPEYINANNKRGGKKYIKEISEKQKSTFDLDEALIAKDSIFDGYYGIQTSEKEMSANEIIDAYHTLWKIEESFRVMKSTLEVRPIFHWKPERIHGHFMVCFLSFILERRLELLLNEAEIENSPEKIRESLNSMQLAKVTVNNEELYIKAKNSPLATKIWDLLKIKLTHNVNSESQLTKQFKIQKKNLWGQLSLF